MQVVIRRNPGHRHDLGRIRRAACRDQDVARVHRREFLGRAEPAGVQERHVGPDHPEPVHQEAGQRVELADPVDRDPRRRDEKAGGRRETLAVEALEEAVDVGLVLAAEAHHLVERRVLRRGECGARLPRVEVVRCARLGKQRALEGSEVGIAEAPRQPRDRRGMHLEPRRERGDGQQRRIAVQRENALERPVRLGPQRRLGIAAPDAERQRAQLRQVRRRPLRPGHGRFHRPAPRARRRRCASRAFPCRCERRGCRACSRRRGLPRRGAGSAGPARRCRAG